MLTLLEQSFVPSYLYKAIIENIASNAPAHR